LVRVYRRRNIGASWPPTRPEERVDFKLKSRD
jgi:hypothetical protein